MPFPATTLLLATAPALLLIAVGLLPFFRRKAPPVIPATALAMGLALVVLQVLVIASRGLDLLQGLADSVPVLLGAPLATFLVSLGVLSHRRRIPVAAAVAGAVIGVFGLWHLGGYVLVRTACGLFPSGGC